MPNSKEFKPSAFLKDLSPTEQEDWFRKQVMKNRNRGRNFKFGNISFKLNGAQVRGLEMEKANIEEEFGMPVTYDQAAVKLFIDRCTNNIVGLSTIDDGKTLWELENPEAAKAAAAKAAKKKATASSKK